MRKGGTMPAALVIEDDPRFSERIVELLRQEGYVAACEVDDDAARPNLSTSSFSTG